MRRYYVPRINSRKLKRYELVGSPALRVQKVIGDGVKYVTSNWTQLHFPLEGQFRL
jgi:hypothetical protein